MRRCWRASWAKGEGENQPTKRWRAPHTLSHVTWGGGAPPPDLGGKPPRAWLVRQVSLGFPDGDPICPSRRPPRENPRAPPPPPSPINSEGERGQPHPDTPCCCPTSPSYTSFSSIVLSEALPENHELHRHHAVMLPEFSLNFSSPLDGSRRRRCPRAVHVLNMEAPSVRR